MSKKNLDLPPKQKLLSAKEILFLSRRHKDFLALPLFKQQYSIVIELADMLPMLMSGGVIFKDEDFPSPFAASFFSYMGQPHPGIESTSITKSIDRRNSVLCG